MGKIEEIIFENYRSAIKDGDYDQAKRAIELAHVLKNKVELDGFQDYDSLKVPSSMVLGQFFNPFPYKYDSQKGTIELSTSVVTLSTSENKLFKLFSENESDGKTINIVSKHDVQDCLWGETKKTSNAIRIAIYRLRKKIEVDPKSPQVLVSIPHKGYIFLGKKVTSF